MKLLDDVVPPRVYIPPRYESKYIIRPSLLKPIREYIRPFCQPDANAKGDPPEYTNVTLQLDTPFLAFHKAKEQDALNRFKLRVRSYENGSDAPISLEIKRKISGRIVKSCVRVPRASWHEGVGTTVDPSLEFKSQKDLQAYKDFVRLVNQTGAKPMVLVRYRREAYHSKIDRYARITFDSRLEYIPTRSWNEWGRDAHWKSMDASDNTGGSYSGLILEIKTTNEVPRWALDLIRKFNLVRRGFCKYSTAMEMESRFHFGTDRF